MIYGCDAAFQHRMINLCWEHLRSTSLTSDSLAHKHIQVYAGIDEMKLGPGRGTLHSHLCNAVNNAAESESILGRMMFAIT